MTFEEFMSSLKENDVPAGCTGVLEALWYDGKGDWEGAHAVAQDIETADGSLIHAYLHRKEGDAGNAMYWYSRAGRKMPKVSLKEEWEDLVREFLGA